MRQDRIIGEVVILGGGPVGNFAAVLCGMLGVKCTVYEKRDSYVREINIKIEKDFFKSVDKVMRRVCRKQRAFFVKLNETINQKNGKIMLKNLEASLKQQAENLNVKYIKKQIKSFQQAKQLHKYTDPIFLDCTGRNSTLRTTQFGTDSQNMKIYNLHHALHINFEAVIPRSFDFKLIYPVIKNSDNLKLGELIVSKNKNKQKQSHFTHHVTVPLFISDELSDIIDAKYPNINRKPLKPFAVSQQQKEQSQQQNEIVKQVQDVIYALFCTLVMADWEIEWDKVVIKKINITCGFSIKRSQDRLICLGDSAAHFAYFKSLNFGLKHAFEFVKILSRYHSLRYELGTFYEKSVVDRFWKKFPAFWPTKAKQGPSAAQYFITNSQLGILAPYIYDISCDTASRIDILPQIKQYKIDERFAVFEQQQKQRPWSEYLNKFEQLRQTDIDEEIFSNRSKKAGTQLISYFIWMNSLSPIKFSETVSFLVNGYYLEKKDFDYFGNVVHNIKGATQNWYNFHQVVKQCIDNSIKGKSMPTNYEKIIKEIRLGCEKEKLSKEQFCTVILQQKFVDKSNKIKDVVLLLKGLQIIAYLLSRPVSQKQQKMQKIEQKEQKLIDEIYNQEIFYSVIEPQQKQEQMVENRQANQ